LSVSGFPLSSGQAVRLVLARALIARPSVLLIDNLLDRLTDRDLQDVLERLGRFKPETTMIIATGRETIAAWAGQTFQI
jgi:putative ABC transport system ATP-binding protein